MSYLCRVLPDHHLGVALFSGPLTVDDFHGVLNQLYGNPAWKPGFDALWDAREVTELVLDEQDVSTVVHHIQRLADRKGPGRTAFVVPRDVDYAIARLLIWLTRNERRQRKAFRQMEEALVWLGREGLAPVVRQSLDANAD